MVYTGEDYAGPFGAVEWWIDYVEFVIMMLLVVVVVLLEGVRGSSCVVCGEREEQIFLFF